MINFFDDLNVSSHPENPKIQKILIQTD